MEHARLSGDVGLLSDCDQTHAEFGSRTWTDRGQAAPAPLAPISAASPGRPILRTWRVGEANHGELLDHLQGLPPSGWTPHEKNSVSSAVNCWIEFRCRASSTFGHVSRSRRQLSAPRSATSMGSEPSGFSGPSRYHFGVRSPSVACLSLRAARRRLIPVRLRLQQRIEPRKDGQPTSSLCCLG